MNWECICLENMTIISLLIRSNETVGGKLHLNTSMQMVVWLKALRTKRQQSRHAPVAVRVVFHCVKLFNFWNMALMFSSASQRDSWTCCFLSVIRRKILFSVFTQKQRFTVLFYENCFFVIILNYMKELELWFGLRAGSVIAVPWHPGWSRAIFTEATLMVCITILNGDIIVSVPNHCRNIII